MLTFSTLGQAGSNHHFVLQQYLAAHGIEEAARIVLFDDFHVGARALIAGEADYLLQCAVHPAAAEITGTYRSAMVVVDAFISPSRAMALVRATHSEEGAGKVGVQPATRTYADLSAWPDVVHEPTVLAVQVGLSEGRYGAGIVFSDFAEKHADRFEVIESSAPSAMRGLSTGAKPWTRAGRWSGRRARSQDNFGIVSDSLRNPAVVEGRPSTCARKRSVSV